MTLGDRICVIDNGRIQQLDNPLAIYEKPVNRFVAGFFGATPMNFFDGTVEFTDNKPHFLIDACTILLPDRMAGPLANHNNAEMTLGIRPEHLSLTPIPNRTKNRIDCTATVVEPLGRHTDICLQTEAGINFTASAPSHTDIKPASQITIYIDTEKAHIFEPGDNGKIPLLTSTRSF